MSRLPKFLYICSALLASVIVSWPYLNPSLKGASLQQVLVQSTNSTDAMRMQNAVLVGNNAEGQRYRIKATEATHPSSENLSKALPDIQLTNITAELLTDEKSIEVTAKQAFYDNGINTLLLSENVELVGNDGLVVRTTDFAIDLNTLTGESRNNVQLESPETQLLAPQVKVLRAGQKIVFTGPTTGRIQP